MIPKGDCRGLSVLPFLTQRGLDVEAPPQSAWLVPRGDERAACWVGAARPRDHELRVPRWRSVGAGLPQLERMDGLPVPALDGGSSRCTQEGRSMLLYPARCCDGLRGHSRSWPPPSLSDPVVTSAVVPRRRLEKWPFLLLGNAHGGSEHLRSAAVGGRVAPTDFVSSLLTVSGGEGRDLHTGHDPSHARLRSSVYRPLLVSRGAPPTSARTGPSLPTQRRIGWLAWCLSVVVAVAGIRSFTLVDAAARGLRMTPCGPRMLRAGARPRPPTVVGRHEGGGGSRPVGGCLRCLGGS